MVERSVWLVLCVGLSWCVLAQAQTPESPEMAFRNLDLPIESRVRDLVSRLTLEEKATQAVMDCAAVPRLGIPRYHWWSECLHGVARAGKATVFPQAIGLAATWNTELHFQIATAISDEARAKHAHGKDSPQYGGLTYWSPTINMARDPRWGRTEETYGEDPFLAGRMAVAFVRGLQGDDPHYLKLVATVKHFAANNEENARYATRPAISERALREYYLPAFRTALVDARCESIMSAYNGVNDVPCSMNTWLLTDLLRAEWGFTGTVVTDVSAPERLRDSHARVATYAEAAAASLKAGADVLSPWRPDFPKYIVEAVKTGLLDEATLDRAVTRSLHTRFRLGLFDPPERVRWSKIPASVVGSDEHIALAREAARQSFVLLENRPAPRSSGKPLLPLDRAGLKSIAVLGPNANRVLFGGYSGEAAREVVTPLEAIRATAGPAIDVRHAPFALAEKAKWFEVIPTTVLRPSAEAAADLHGLKGQYFKTVNLQDEAFVRIDPIVDFNWAKKAPEPGMPADKFSIRWSGVIVVPESGEYEIGATSDDGIRLGVDGRVLIDAWHDRAPTHDSGLVTLEAGKPVPIVIEYFDRSGDASVRLDWLTPATRKLDRLTAEYDLAKSSDLVVAVLGLGPEYEDEDHDRMELGLPVDQERYLRRLVEVNPNLVLVLMNGGPLSAAWAKEHVPSIVEVWYPGEEGGTALAELLFGSMNPSGRLPITVVRDDTQLPNIGDYEVSRGRTYRYLEQNPLWPFGHGLSYTTFNYGTATVDTPEPASDADVVVSVPVTNAGSRAGDEVVQLYVRDPESVVQQPLERLVGFARLSLKAGETATATFRVHVRDLGWWDQVQHRFVVEPGAFEFAAGASSADLRARVSIRVK